MKRTIAARAAASLLLGILAGVANAGTNHISQGGLTWTLVDLDLADGVAPSLQFLPPEIDLARIYMSAFAGGTRYEHTALPHRGDPLVAELDYSPAARVAARIDGREDPATLVLSVDSMATLEPNGAGTTAWLSGGALPFVLSANTAVTFHSTVLLRGVRGDEPGIYDAWLASGTMTVTLDRPDPGQSVFTDYTTVALSPSPGDPLAIDTSRMLTVGYSNRTASSLAGDVTLTAVSLTTIAPVPEPGPLPLALAGLAVLGWAARRRG